MNKTMEFPNYRVFETEFAGRPLKVETGKMTQLANAACLVSYGETVVHVAVTASEKPRDGMDLVPFSYFETTDINDLNNVVNNIKVS